ncbi:hypothetical protein B0J12DRAFT_649177 [Macrophomina phaseolina]|uniref:Secreted protein n=1 Tax=Macrophomina phaseolina TaxID=35725 RepID=A0ABQ8GLG2_9PEZI|nr:hypothetical protein B0J12DRAFT_649177 [Macrophomina phaseolina]
MHQSRIPSKWSSCCIYASLLWWSHVRAPPGLTTSSRKALAFVFFLPGEAQPAEHSQRSKDPWCTDKPSFRGLKCDSEKSSRHEYPERLLKLPFRRGLEMLITEGEGCAASEPVGGFQLSMRQESIPTSLELV